LLLDGVLLLKLGLGVQFVDIVAEVLLVEGLPALICFFVLALPPVLEEAAVSYIIFVGQLHYLVIETIIVVENAEALGGILRLPELLYCVGPLLGHGKCWMLLCFELAQGHGWSIISVASSRGGAIIRSLSFQIYIILICLMFVEAELVVQLQGLAWITSHVDSICLRAHVFAAASPLVLKSKNIRPIWHNCRATEAAVVIRIEEFVVHLFIFDLQTNSKIVFAEFEY